MNTPLNTDITPAANQILRQYGKHLARSDCYLRVSDDERHYALFTARNKAKPSARIDAAHIKNWQQADLLENAGGDLVLSPSGKAWLRRAQATHSPFMAQHQIRAKTLPEDAPHVDVNVSQTPLDWLRARSKKTGKKTNSKNSLMISDIEFDAGEKLRADFERAHLSPKMGMNWERPIFVDGGGGATDVSDHALDARERVRAALTHAGPGLADMLLSVCCCLQGLEESETAYSLPRRSGKVMLKLALIRLSVFYGLQSETSAAASFRMR